MFGIRSLTVTVLLRRIADRLMKSRSLAALRDDARGDWMTRDARDDARGDWMTRDARDDPGCGRAGAGVLTRQARDREGRWVRFAFLYWRRAGPAIDDPTATPATV